MYTNKNIQEIPRIICIYQIKGKNKIYIGSSFDLNRRIRGHFYNLKKGTHHNKYLQNYYNAVPNLVYQIKILESFSNITKEELLAKEDFYIKLHKPEFNYKDALETNYSAYVNAKKLFQYDLEGNFIKEYSCVADAERSLGFLIKDYNPKAKERSSGGFMFRLYKSDKIDPYVCNTGLSHAKPLTAYTLLGKRIKTFSNIRECVKELFPEENYSLIKDLITSNLKGVFISVRNYRFSKENLPRLSNEKIKNSTKRHIILQFDENKNFIRSWRNALNVQEVLGLDQGKVQRCSLNGKYYEGYWEKLGSQSDELLESLEG